MTDISAPPAAPKWGFLIPDELFNSLVHDYTRDLTEMARQGRFDPVTGRDKELDRLVLILLQKVRKNAILLGGPGVGKTALFVALAQALVEGRVPKPLRGARFLELDIPAMAAGAATRGEFEGRFIPLIKGISERNEAKIGPPIIIALDEIHQTMASAKTAKGAGSVGDIMKPHLTAGNLYVVGATTREEYQDYIKPDGAIDRRFQQVELEAPNEVETVRILQNLRPSFTRHYGIDIPDPLIEKIVDLTAKYLRRRNQPDKSILTLDGACARCIQKDPEATILDNASVLQSLAAEAGVNPDALE
jgi:ATP-dependent Clp protease ATP-binding subunit ClpA